MIAAGRASVARARPADRLGHIGRALGQVVVALKRVVTPLFRAALRPRRPAAGPEVTPSITAPAPALPPERRLGRPEPLALADVDVIEVEPEISEQPNATVLERLQLSPVRSCSTSAPCANLESVR